MTYESQQSPEGRNYSPDRLFWISFVFADERLDQLLDDQGYRDLYQTAQSEWGMRVTDTPDEEDERLITKIGFEARMPSNKPIDIVYESASYVLFEWLRQKGLGDIELMDVELRTRQTNEVHGEYQNISIEVNSFVRQLEALAKLEPSDFHK